MAAEKDADPACPGSRVVVTTNDVEIILDEHGFWNRCTAKGCTYVSRRTPSKAVARRWATRHNNDLPNDGRDT